MGISSGVACALSALTGCYFAYPPKMPPVHSGPLLVEGQLIEVKTRDVKAFIGACSEQDISEGTCEMRHGELRHYIMNKRTRFSYGDRYLNYAELREIIDPQWPQTVETIKHLKGTCELSLVPSALAALSLAVGVLVPLLESGHISDDAKTYFYIGGGAGAVLFTGLSYPLGGAACVRASGAANAEYEWNLDDWEEYPGSDHLNDDLLKAVADFNARASGSPKPEAPGDSSSAEPKAKEPTPAAVVAPIESKVRDALLATGQFPSFIAAIDNAKDWKAFDAPAYTIFAPTEAAFAALSDQERERMLTTESGMVVVSLHAHVVHEKLTRKQLDHEVRIKSYKFSKKGKQLLLGHSVVGEPIDTGDGIIYPIDRLLEVM